MVVEEPLENYTTGWIKLFRSLKNKPWYNKSEYVHIWIHLLIKANHKPGEWVYKGQSIQVKRGQFIASRKSISEETGVNESKVERILKYFEIEQQIEQENLFTSRLISIVSYENYQTSEQDIEQQMNSKRTASEQQVNTNKNVKNKKNEEEVKVKYLPNISLTKTENDKLVAVHGLELVTACYDYLSKYKIEKSYSTKSDYLTILRWVIDAVKKKGNIKPSTPITKTGRPGKSKFYSYPDYI